MSEWFNDLEQMREHWETLRNQEPSNPTKEHLQRAEAEGMDAKLCNQAEYRNHYNPETQRALYGAWLRGYRRGGMGL